MSFIHENFLLSNDQAVRLYHEYAKDEPILDFHNHLPPDEIANNRRVENLAEAWLEADIINGGPCGQMVHPKN